MKGKTKYTLFYLMGQAEWAVVFCFLGMLNLSHRRLWMGYLLIALFSGIGTVAMYSTRKVSEHAIQFKYRSSIVLITLLAIGACLWWTVALAHGMPPLSLDFAAAAATAMFVGVCWFVYRSMLIRVNPDRGK